MLFIRPHKPFDIKSIPPCLSVPKWYIRKGKRAYVGTARLMTARLPMLGKVTKFPAPSYPRIIDWVNATKQPRTPYVYPATSPYGTNRGAYFARFTFD